MQSKPDFWICPSLAHVWISTAGYGESRDNNIWLMVGISIFCQSISEDTVRLKYTVQAQYTGI